MLSRKNDTWDLQFTEDGNYLLNFGWIYARPSTPVIVLYRRALAQYISKNMWDVSRVAPLLSSLRLELSVGFFAARTVVGYGSKPRRARNRRGLQSAALVDLRGERPEGVYAALAQGEWSRSISESCFAG